MTMAKRIAVDRCWGLIIDVQEFFLSQIDKRLQAKHVSGNAKIFEKDFFDLTKEKKIADYIARLKQKQVIVAGCETDVCVLQSCLGLLGLGYDVYVVEELVFSSSRNVDAAIARMKAAGAVFLTYKSLYYEMVEAMEGARHREHVLATFGPLPGDLPDAAVQGFRRRNAVAGRAGVNPTP